MLSTTLEDGRSSCCRCGSFAGNTRRAGAKAPGCSRGSSLGTIGGAKSSGCIRGSSLGRMSRAGAKGCLSGGALISLACEGLSSDLDFACNADRS